MARLSPWPSGPAKDERPDRPFTGYKLAHAVLSADGATASSRASRWARPASTAPSVTGLRVEPRHAPPRRWCGCGFYCLHDLADARSLACATENRSALILEVTASGRYIRYERGLRYSRQRVRAVLDAQCACGRPGAALADAGSGLIGWRHLAPVCDSCTAGRPALTLQGVHRAPGRHRSASGHCCRAPRWALERHGERPVARELPDGRENHRSRSSRRRSRCCTPAWMTCSPAWTSDRHIAFTGAKSAVPVDCDMIDMWLR